MKEILVPRLNANDDQVELAYLYIQNGAYVKTGQEIVDLGSSKATVTVRSEHEGYIIVNGKRGSKVKVGAVLATISKEKPILNQSIGQSKIENAPLGITRLSPAAEAYLHSMGKSISDFEVKGLVTTDMLQGPKSRAVSKEYSNLPVPEGLRTKRINARKSIEIDHLSAGEEGNLTSTLTVQFLAEDLLKRLKMHFAGGLLPLIIHEFSQLLDENPSFTSFFFAGEIYHYDRVNMGVAIDIDNGLKIVTIRNSEKLFPQQIYEALTDFAMRDLTNELTESDLSDSTVTVTDLSAQNILHFRPLLNGRQAVILGVGGDSELPGHPISLNITFDHRVLSGREVALFLNDLKQRLLQFKALS